LQVAIIVGYIGFIFIIKISEITLGVLGFGR